MITHQAYLTRDDCLLLAKASLHVAAVKHVGLDSARLRHLAAKLQVAGRGSLSIASEWRLDKPRTGNST